MKPESKTGIGKRGRPRGLASKGINAGFPSGLAEKIEHAAYLRGVAVAAFIQEAVADRADRVIEAESHWQLTREVPMARGSVPCWWPRPANWRERPSHEPVE